MPAIVQPQDAHLEPIPHRVRWTREQCRAIEEAEILIGRYELVDGEILTKMLENPLHRLCVLLIREWLISVFGGLFVQSQSTIDVGAADPAHNQPVPDAAVTLEPNSRYLTRHPGPDDLLLVAEVSDTTLRYDMTAKAILYSRAGIREYWIVDVTGRRLIVHRLPQPSGYSEIVAYAADEQVSTLARPDVSVSVSALLPPS